VSAVTGAPTNDVTLFIRALYQDCADENHDYLAVDFLDGTEHFTASHKTTRDAARTSLATVSDHNVVYFSSRTNFVDVRLQEWMQDEDIEQVVVIAAGFDSRAYRIPFHGPYFELDMPSVIDAKKEKVEKLDLNTTGLSVTYIPADLRNTTVDVALKAAPGFDATKKTVYIVEGLIYYLHQEDVDKLFKGLGAVAASGSRLVFDYTNECLVEEDCSNLNKAEIKIFLEIMELKGEPWFSGFNWTAVKPWLASNGFTLGEQISFQNAKVDPRLNVTTWTNSTVMGQMNFVTAVKA